MNQQAEMLTFEIPDHIDPARVVDFDLFGDHRFIEAGHPYDGLLRLCEEVGRGISDAP